VKSRPATGPKKGKGAARPKRRADPSPPRVRRRSVDGDTAAAHREVGRSVRIEVPLKALADWTPPADRPDPVALLVEQGESRVQDLVPIRYGRMLVSPFLRADQEIAFREVWLYRRRKERLTVRVADDRFIRAQQREIGGHSPSAPRGTGSPRQVGDQRCDQHDTPVRRRAAWRVWRGSEDAA